MNNLSFYFCLKMAVIWADSCGKSTSRKLQAEAHGNHAQKAAHKIVNFFNAMTRNTLLSASSFFI